MKFNPGFKLLFILVIFFAQFVMLITFVNNVVANVAIQQRTESQIAEASKKRKTLSTNIEQELNNRLSQDRDSAQVEIINSGNIKSWQSIQKNQPTNQQNVPSNSGNVSETIIR